MWEYEADGNPAGPVSNEELRRLLQSGVVNYGTPVRPAGASQWEFFAAAVVSCAECSNLFAAADVARFGAVSVCAGCKPLYLQKLREGVDVAGLGVRLAERWRRLVGNLIDGVINLIIFLPVQYFSGAFERVNAESQADPFGALYRFRPENLLWGALGLVVMVSINWTFLGRGQTIGKRIIGTRIVRADGSECDRWRIILRRLLPMQGAALLPVVGIVFLGVDTLSIFRSDRRMIHDLIADTKVVEGSEQKN